MRVVSRINLPESADVSSLYIQCNEAATINYQDNDLAVICRLGGKISSNAYFNSFYESYYAKYTNLDSLYYLLRLEGDFQVSVYRECGENDRELIEQQTLTNCQLSDSVKVPLPQLQQSHIPQGRIYFELECVSERGVFQEGLIATEQPQTHEVSLAIITCTFKKEAYIKKTINTLLQDQLLQNKPLKIFVVDNGQTLSADDFPERRVKLIPSRNVGGSGGFTRGLFEVLQENTATHFLFMDDDIELDSESIYRLFALYEYGKSDFAIAGSMIDLVKKHILFEAGLLYGKARSDNNKFKPFGIIRLNHNLDLKNSNNINLLLSDKNIDFGGFYFFAVSKKVVEQIGLLLPLFIKIDDIEFCLRLKEKFGDKIVAFPAIAVWHETFFNKASVWDYYYYRNDLVTHAIHKPLKHIDAVIHFTQSIVFSLMLFDYNHVEMLVKAFEDYIKGPDFLKNNDPEMLHTNILAISQSHKTQTVQRNYLPPNNQDNPQRASSWKKIVSLLTLNGHFLPNFLSSDEDVFLWQTPNHAGQRSRALAKKRVLIFKEGSNCLFQNQIDKLVGIKLLTRWLKVAAISSIKWSALSREWKNASSELSSLKFWQQCLGLNIDLKDAQDRQEIIEREELGLTT